MLRPPWRLATRVGVFALLAAAMVGSGGSGHLGSLLLLVLPPLVNAAAGRRPEEQIGNGGPIRT